jgi:hypothetical protein
MGGGESVMGVGESVMGVGGRGGGGRVPCFAPFNVAEILTSCFIRCRASSISSSDLSSSKPGISSFSSWISSCSLVPARLSAGYKCKASQASVWN